MSASRTRRNERRERRARMRALAWPNLPVLLLAALAQARRAWLSFCDRFETPASLAAREYIRVSEHAEMCDWIYHLELLMRRFMFAGASALNLILRPLQPRVPRARKRRRVIIWPDRPRGWPARFRVMPRRGNRDAGQRPVQNKRIHPVVPSFPLARRLEALRRVLADPVARIRRLGIRLARLSDTNARANAPREFRVRPWTDTPRRLTPGRRIIAAAMQIVQPFACAAANAWNLTVEPG